MATKRVLITGGAGFIGTHLASAVLKSGYSVRIVDNFSPQIHSSPELSSNLKGEVELVVGDIRDRDLMSRALDGVDCLVHLAAETGTGQSMYEIDRYFSANVQGTATILDLLQNSNLGESVSSIIVASSRAVYGEGAYRCAEHGMVYPSQRKHIDLSNGFYDPTCPFCGSTVSLLPTPESSPFMPMSMYGLTKQVQEQAILLYAQTRGINAFGLRYQNVYGPGQSLKNPYTGILAIFSNLVRQDQPIDIYEDGLESRDFIYINDVVEATLRSIHYEGKFVGALNVGTGQAVNVMTVAEEIRAFFGGGSAIKVTGDFRMGDIRHNIADIAKLRKVLGFVPETSFRDGLSNFLAWANAEEAQDRSGYINSVRELAARGLMGGKAS